MNPVFALFQRELRIARRVGGGASIGAVFFLILVAVIPFALGPDLRLLAKVGPVDKEEDSAGPAKLDEPVNKADRREGLTAAHLHLYEGARASLSEGALYVLHRLNLGIPHAAGIKHRHMLQPAQEGLRLSISC